VLPALLIHAPPQITWWPPKCLPSM
jgi:hypothetical protein